MVFNIKFREHCEHRKKQKLLNTNTHNKKAVKSMSPNKKKRLKEDAFNFG